MEEIQTLYSQMTSSAISIDELTHSLLEENARESAAVSATGSVPVSPWVKARKQPVVTKTKLEPMVLPESNNLVEEFSMPLTPSPSPPAPGTVGEERQPAQVQVFRPESSEKGSADALDNYFTKRRSQDSKKSESHKIAW